MLAGFLKSLFGRRVENAVSSLSDNESYTAACARAAGDPAFFKNFRRDPDYTRILEHVSDALGRAYFDLIRQDAAMMGAMAEFKRNDEFGNPRCYEYPPAGMISPTTLRYIKVLSDLKKCFGSLDGMRICEIGAGYGGQCRIINALFKPAAYCMIDLAPALKLAQRYLENFALPAALSFKSMSELAAADYDLVISNYAFTELARPVQDEYLTKAVLRSRRGYITYNEITPLEFSSYKADELLELIPGAQKIREEPLFTHPDNCIILWNAN